MIGGRERDGVPADAPRTSSPLSDHELLQQFREGDQLAATQIYLRYADRLRALARHRCPATLARCIDAEDIVQSVFGSFFRRLSRGLYDVPDGEELWKLLLVMALNKIRDQGSFHLAARRDVRRRLPVADLETLLADGATSQEDGLHLRLVVEEVMEPLPEAVQQIIEYRLVGHEVAEIAQLTGRSKRTVERNLQAFRKRLSTVLGGTN